jgi:hypothetical protein
MNIFNQGATMLSKFTLSLLLSIPAIVQSAEQQYWVNVKCHEKASKKNPSILPIPLEHKESNCIDVHEALAKTFNVSYDKVALILWGKDVSNHENLLTDLTVPLNQAPTEWDLMAIIDKCQ